MVTTTNDESTLNSDADNPPRTSTVAPTRESDNLVVDQTETKCVEQWHRDIKESRQFDEAIRRLYAMDRRYGRGDTSSIVHHSLIQSFIDLLVAFLVARNPDYECPPAERVGDAELENAELYGKTMAIVVSHLLRSARLKRVAEKIVRSALTVGIGWLKAVWHQQYETDPQIARQVKDAQENIARIEASRRKLQSGEYEDLDKQLTLLQQQEASLAENMERLVANGMSLAMINPEDMIISIEVESIIDIEEASWAGHRYYLHIDRAEAAFPRIPIAQLRSAAKYSPKAPVGRKKDGEQVSGHLANCSAEDADRYQQGSSGSRTAKFVCCYEVWNGELNQWFTLIDGIQDRYATVPIKPPTPTTRFYPFFAVSFTEIDGERHPQSLIQRSYKLQDEIDRTLQELVIHRRRTKPQTLFDSSTVSEGSVKKIKDGNTAEFIPVKMLGAPEKRDVRRAFFPKQYPNIDPGLYDISIYVRSMETEWSIQEALTGTVQVAKTATEAEIQQAGTQAKSGHKRDKLELMLNDLGLYTAESAAWNLTRDDVVKIAGNESLWIEIDDVEELQSLLAIEVKAGSSGKPDTIARREAWMAMSSAIEKLIMSIGNLRQSTPQQQADCLQALLLETADRLGERINMKEFIPQAPEAPIPNPMIPARTLTNDELGGLMASMAAAPPPRGGGDGKPNGKGPPAEGQEAMAPTARQEMV